MKPLTKASFDWLKFYQETFDIKDIRGLLFLYRYCEEVAIEQSYLKEAIINNLSLLEPHAQNEVLQYQL